MANVEIYTVNYCPYSKKAKAILDNNGIPYKEIDITGNEPEMRAKLAQMTGGQQTVPQIFVNGKYIGGCTELQELEASGKLGELVSK